MADTMNESSFRGPREVPVFRTDAAEGDTVYRWNLNESKFRADNRQFNFRSESPRLDSPVLGVSLALACRLVRAIVGPCCAALRTLLLFAGLLLAPAVLLLLAVAW